MRSTSGLLPAVGRTPFNAYLGWMPVEQARYVVNEGDVDAGSLPRASYWFYGSSAFVSVDSMSAL